MSTPERRVEPTMPALGRSSELKFDKFLVDAPISVFKSILDNDNQVFFCLFDQKWTTTLVQFVGKGPMMNLNGRVPHATQCIIKNV